MTRPQAPAVFDSLPRGSSHLLQQPRLGYTNWLYIEGLERSAGARERETEGSLPTTGFKSQQDAMNAVRPSGAGDHTGSRNFPKLSEDGRCFVGSWARDRAISSTAPPRVPANRVDQTERQRPMSLWRLWRSGSR